MERYEVIRELDKGTYGTVLQARDKQTGEIVAIKKIKSNFANWKDCLALRELKVLRKLSHPNIVRLYNAFVRQNKLFLVFEFMDKNLYTFIQEQDGVLIEESRIQAIMFQILNGLDYIHRKGYFHRDVKPENILIKNNVVKTADFGLVREIKSSPPYTDYVSTRWYRAPEVLLGASYYSAPIDIWAAGAIMAELYTLRPLFPGQSEIDQILKICHILGTPDTVDPKYSWEEGVKLASKFGFQFPNMSAVSLGHVIPNASSEAIHLMSNMLRFDPKSRLSARQALRHPYFSNAKRVTLPRISIFDRYNSQVSYQKLLASNPFRRFSKEVGNATPSFGNIEQDSSLFNYNQSNGQERLFQDIPNYTSELISTESPLLPQLDHCNIDSTIDGSLLSFDVGKFLNCWKRDIGYLDSTSNSTDLDLYEAKQIYSGSNSQNSVASITSPESVDAGLKNMGETGSVSKQISVHHSASMNTNSTGSTFQTKFNLSPGQDISTQDQNLDFEMPSSWSNPGQNLQAPFEATLTENNQQISEMSPQLKMERNIESLLHEVDDVTQEAHIQELASAIPQIYSQVSSEGLGNRPRKSSTSFSRFFNWTRYS